MEMQWKSESDVSDAGSDTDSSELKKQVSCMKKLFGPDVNDFHAVSDIEDFFNSPLPETVDLMAYQDLTRVDEQEFEVLYRDENGSLSLAYERLPGIPKRVAEKLAPTTHTLDLSYNNIRDLSFLSYFKILHTLVLDNNTALNEMAFPFMPSIRILWLNKCDINNLPKLIQRLKVCTPNVRQLSLLGNPGAFSLFNGATAAEHNDYIMYVVGMLEKLEVLDDNKITDVQRANAKTHIGAYAMSGGPMKFMERIAGSNLFTFFKYDHRKPRSQISTSPSSPPASNKSSSTKYQSSSSKTRSGRD